MNPERYKYPPYPPGYYPRDEILAQCPDLVCRRAGGCLAQTQPKPRPCQKIYMTADEARDELADRLFELHAEWRAKNPNYKFRGDIDARKRELHDALKEAEEKMRAEMRGLFLEEFT